MGPTLGGAHLSTLSLQDVPAYTSVGVRTFNRETFREGPALCLILPLGCVCPTEL